MSWNQEEEQTAIKLRNEGLTVQEIADKLTEMYGREFTYWSVQKKLPRLKKHSQHPVKETGYKETTEILHDGSHKSDKLLRMSANESKDVNYLLEAHGYDVNAWELVSARNNIWNAYSKLDGVQTLYSSKITVKPKTNDLDWDELIRRIQDVPKVTIKPKYIPSSERYLNIPLFDMHFGVSDYEHYKPTQAKVLDILKNNYKEVLLIIGQDLFHHNDHRNRTASGREIEHADMTKAWEDAVKFYEPIIHEALKTSGKVSGMFIKGNHSESLEWSFTKYLEARFPQVTFDSNFKERKVHMLGSVMVASTHGDKAKKRLGELFSTEFPIEWSQAKTREAYTGHLHTEEVVDKGGIVLRQLSTRNKIDQYHDDNGYTMSHKRFQVFEYSREELKTIHYV